MNLKIYVQNLSWRGSIVVVSTSEASARELMKDSYNYDPDVSVEEHEIKDGLVHVDLGDC